MCIFVNTTNTPNTTTNTPNTPPMLKLWFGLFSFVSLSLGHQIHFALKQNNINKLYDILNDVNNPKSDTYLQFWDTKDIISLISPTQEYRNEIIDWLYSIGITQVIDRGDSISFDYTHQKADLIQNIQIPENIQSGLDMILGLKRPNSKLIKLANLNKVKKSNKLSNGLVSKEVIERLYNISALDGNGIDIGVVQYYSTEGFSGGDLLYYQYENGIKTPRNVTKMVGHELIDGVEGNLDIQIISNLENSNMWFIIVKGWIYDFASDFFLWKNYPTIISQSYGWSEYDQCDLINCFNTNGSEYIRRTNTELAKIALKGVTMCVSSGDAGSPGRTEEECDNTPLLKPIYPGSSPWVMSVGASYILDNSHNNNYKTKTPICKTNKCITGTIHEECTLYKTGWTSGCGFGVYDEYQPTWQKSSIEKYLSQNIPFPPKYSFNRNGRAYPDISVVGHNCAIYSSRELKLEDGTSCSAPIMATLMGHMSSKIGKKLGLFTPTLYQMYNLYTDKYQTYTDITVGNSSCTEYRCCGNDWGFVASQGWDAVSGLGYPNIGNILALLKMN